MTEVLEVIVTPEPERTWAMFEVRWTRFRDPFITGTVKADGCLDMPEIVHLCGPADVAVLQRALTDVYLAARKVLDVHGEW